MWKLQARDDLDADARGAGARETCKLKCIGEKSCRRSH